MRSFRNIRWWCIGVVAVFILGLTCVSVLPVPRYTKTWVAAGRPLFHNGTPLWRGLRTAWPLPVPSCSSPHRVCYYDDERNILLALIVNPEEDIIIPSYIDGEILLFGNNNDIPYASVRPIRELDVCIAVLIDNGKMQSSLTVPIQRTAMDVFPQLTLTSENYFDDKRMNAILLEQCSSPKGRSALEHLFSMLE